MSAPCSVMHTASVLVHLFWWHWTELRLRRLLIELHSERCICTAVLIKLSRTPQAYEEYFKYLDRTGGFFYERWGDAPVHSLGAVMLLNSSQVRPFWAGTGSWTWLLPGLPQGLAWQCCQRYHWVHGSG